MIDKNNPILIKMGVGLAVGGMVLSNSQKMSSSPLSWQMLLVQIISKGATIIKKPFFS